MENKELIINIEVKVKKCKKTKDDEFGKKGDEFYSYKGYSPAAGWTDLRLMQNCTVQKLEKYCTLHVNPSQISIDRKAKFPIIWISGLVENQVEYTNKVQNVAEFFGQ